MRPHNDVQRKAFIMTSLRIQPLVLALAFAFAPLAASAAAAAPATATAAVQRVVLKTGVVDGKMVFVDEHGKVNPTLKARVGETLELVLSSGEGAQHDFRVPELKVASKPFDATSGVVTLRLTPTQAGKFVYICGVPGHRQIGMEGQLEVTGDAAAKPTALKAATAAAPVAATPAPIAAARADAVSIAQDPNAVPAPLAGRAPELVKYRLETTELQGKLDDGTTYTYWTFNNKVPGPMLRVREGDTVELTLANAKSSTQFHSIDLHAVIGGMGGGADTQVAPGQEKQIRFRALHPGLYVYHCATPMVAHHISKGMYGLILVEPAAGLPKVDHEFYVMQGDMYTDHNIGTKGHHETDADRMADEMPTYYVFNGAVGSLTKEFQMNAKVGESVRVYFGVGGPNKISSFHVIGEVFDKVYSEAAFDLAKHDVQTTLVAPGGATVVEFTAKYPGKFALVDHALSRANKGALGVITVTGAADPDVYLPSQKGEEHMKH
jgi:nitrite reductase (NO-forming)